MKLVQVEYIYYNYCFYSPEKKDEPSSNYHYYYYYYYYP